LQINNYSMANPVCLSPLKFYDDFHKQNRYRSFAYGHVAPLITNPNVVSPFQLVVTDDLSQLYIVDANTNKRITLNVAQAFRDAGLIYSTVNNYKIIRFKGLFPLAGTLKAEGQYYIEMLAGSWYYSEVFCYTNDVSDCLRIEYWNPESDFKLNNGVISFDNDFRFILLLKTELGKPEYSFEEEVTSRLGYSFIESQVSKKTYKFNVVIPEYLCDAMRIIRLCSNKRITCRGETYDAITFNMEVDWQEQGDLASVNCEFDVDNIIVNLGGFKQEPLGGDFNNDYNIDFNT